MGIFDLFKKKKTAPLQDTDEYKHVYYYYYAYKFLPSVIESTPDLYNMLSTGQSQILRELWDRQQINFQESPNRYIEADGLTSYTIKVSNNQHIVVVQFPYPFQPPQAYFAGIMPDKENKLRYYTLESSLPRGRTVLGEWRQGNHMNCGTGPAVNIELFANTVYERIHQL